MNVSENEFTGAGIAQVKVDIILFHGQIIDNFCQLSEAALLMHNLQTFIVVDVNDGSFSVQRLIGDRAGERILVNDRVLRLIDSETICRIACEERRVAIDVGLVETGFIASSNDSANRLFYRLQFCVVLE